MITARVLAELKVADSTPAEVAKRTGLKPRVVSTALSHLSNTGAAQPVGTKGRGFIYRFVRTPRRGRPSDIAL